MTSFIWPDDMPSRFGRDIITSRHDLHNSPEFTDEGLARILDDYPRDALGLYAFPPHGEGLVKAIHGRASQHDGAALVEAVKAGQIWLNLRAVNSRVPRLASLADTIFGDLETGARIKTLKRDVGLLISSPNIHVHYHLDIPLVCLVQLRGVKTLHLYPARAPFAPEEQIEAVALRERDEEISFRSDFERDVQAMTLEPGMAITWPQNAPHRVQNTDTMNVSLSCEFMTLPALMRANAIYANGVMRRRFGLGPKLPQAPGLGLAARAALARVFKVVARPPEMSPTPVTFDLDRATHQPVLIEAGRAA